MLRSQSFVFNGVIRWGAMVMSTTILVHADDLEA
jgi:hypothetical protein